MDFKTYFILFILYSFIGWSLEVIISLFKHKKFINRGFLIGPYCPIYGFGGILLLLLLKKYLGDPVALFFISIFIISLLEYFTSYIMEEHFNTRWWDYGTSKFNINGRICLEMLFVFGGLGLLSMYVINPLAIKVLSNINPAIKLVITSIIATIFIIDNVVSYNIISNFKNTAKNTAKDSTEEVTRKVKETLKNQTIFYRRLIDAFPLLKFTKLNKKKYKKKKKNRKRK